MDYLAVLQRLLGPETPFATELSELLNAFPFVGLHGSAGVGKSWTATHVLEQLDFPAISIDLERCASYDDLAHQWARALAVATLSPEAVFEIETIKARDWSAATFDAVTGFAEQFGPHVADLFQNGNSHRDSAFDPDHSLRELTGATAALGGGHPAVLFIDHLEAPGLSFRHPIDAAQLLWAIRSFSQTTPNIRILLACRTAAIDLAADKDAAFYGDGIWVRQAPPRSEDFARAAEVAYYVTDEILEYTRGHIAATLEILDHLGTANMIFGSVQHVAQRQHETGTRSLDYARSLHRLGSHLLTALAQRRGPYEASRSELPKTVAAAMTKLTLGGLIQRTDDGDPQITDPRVQWWINGGTADRSTQWTIAVRQRKDGTYEGIRPGAPSPSLVRNTQREAISASRAILKRAGGGELVIRNDDVGRSSEAVSGTESD